MDEIPVKFINSFEDTAYEKKKYALHISCHRSSAEDLIEEKFMRAAGSANPLLEVCVSMRDKGARVCCMNRYRETPLHFAAEQWSKDLVVWLLRMGADPDATNNVGSCPLHYALGRPTTDQGNPDGTVRELLRAGARVDMSNKGGLQPLQKALASGNATAAHEILEFGRPLCVVRTSLVDKVPKGYWRGHNALEIAAKRCPEFFKVTLTTWEKNVEVSMHNKIAILLHIKRRRVAAGESPLHGGIWALVLKFAGRTCVNSTT